MHAIPKLSTLFEAQTHGAGGERWLKAQRSHESLQKCLQVVIYKMLCFPMVQSMLK